MNTENQRPTPRPPSASALPLRPYQLETIQAVQNAEARGIRRPLVVIPTGGGKTVIFSHLIARRGDRALILAHRDELLRQAADKMRQIAPGVQAGIVKADEDEHDAHVVIGSVQTLANHARLDRAGRFGTIIVDEAHHATADTYRTILKRLGAFTADGPLTVGFTATAGRADGIGLGHVWEEIVYTRGIIQMIAEGYLVDIAGLAVTSEIDLGHVGSRGGDFDDGQLGDELERSGALTAAALAYKRYAAARRGIAFTPTVSTAHSLAAELRGQGIPAEAVDGGMKRCDRQAVLSRLHSGQTQVVANAMVLTEGFDEPAVSCVLTARPTKSATLFTQMVGRALRPYPGKIDALLLDVAGATAENGIATIADLAGLAPGAVKPGQSLSEAAEEQARGAAANATVRSMTARTVNLFARSSLRWLKLDNGFVLPAGTTSILLVPRADGTWDVWEHTRGKPPAQASAGLDIGYAQGVGEEIARARGGALSRRASAWRDRPPTQAQRDALTRMGKAAALPAISTSGQASDLMAMIIGQRTIRTILAATKAGTAA